MESENYEAGLIDEISWLRGAIHTLMVLAEGVEDLETMARVLGAVGTAITRLGQALKLQRELVKDISSADVELRETLREIGKRISDEHKRI